MKTAALLFALTLTALAPAAAAPQSEPVQDQYVTARLLSAVDSVHPGESFTVALELAHDAHWHTYWRNPGDSGMATSITWTLPEGWTAGPIQWPVPQIVSMGGLVTYAYEGKAFLRVKITPPADAKPGSDVTLAAKADWLMCNPEKCVPGTASLEISLPVTSAMPAASKWAFDLDETLEDLPAASAPWTASATVNAEDTAITLTLKAPAGGFVKQDQIYFYAYDGMAVAPGAPQPFEKTADGYTVTLTRPDAAPPLERLTGVVTGDPGWDSEPNPTAFQIDVPVTKAAGGPAAGTTTTPEGNTTSSTGTVMPETGKATVPPSAETVGFTAWAPKLIEQFGTPGAFVIALLGGLILNLMPCVLPVLSIKVLSLVKQAGEHRSETLKHGVAYTAGVVLSFLVVAGILLALRAAGERIGWGFQMQSPVFVFLLAALFFVFALNLFGVFEIGATMVGIDRHAAKSGGVKASFGTGALATLAATPCTAPFMGAALGFAVGQSAVMALVIFAGLGFGMALPFLLLAVFPHLLHFVPKPGPWMETFKQFLGFLLMATVAWLVWVFATQTDPNAMLVLLLALVVLGLAVWVYGRWSTPVRTPGVRRAAVVAALVLGGLGLTVGVVNARQADLLAAQTAQTTRGSDDIAAWQPFDPTRLKALRAEGTPVFVDFTASWCLVCQVNKGTTLHTPEVDDAFRRDGVVKMIADWTRRDPVITEALEEFGRNGVPLYVLYGRDPAAPPQILPETLTPGIVLDALAKMK